MFQTLWYKILILFSQMRIIMKKLFLLLPILLFSLSYVNSSYACAVNDMMADKTPKRMLACKLWPCTDTVGRIWKQCLEQTLQAAIKAKNDKKVIQLTKELAEISATQALNVKAPEPITLDDKEKKQAYKDAQEAMYKKLYREDCPHTTPCGMSSWRGV